MRTLETITVYENKVRSQNGEDGIIEELFNRLGTDQHPLYSVEFGVEQGLECNTSHLLLDKRWNGLLIEGNPEHFKQLINHYQRHHALDRVIAVNEFVTKENIARIFKKNRVPDEFDLLSIDIDGNDYWVWQALKDYRPRVVVIEYNSSYPPPIKWVMKYNRNHQWNATNYYGASLTSLATLGEQLGYSLIGTESKGVNAFFIRNDLINLCGFPAKTPEEAYTPPNFGGHPRGDGPFVEI